MQWAVMHPMLVTGDPGAQTLLLKTSMLFINRAQTSANF